MIFTKTTKATSPKIASVYSFGLQFLYALTGWEGSATDAYLWDDAIRNDFVVPEGKYYLADAGFGTCDQLFLPYHGVCYHLAEWGHANVW